MSRVYPVLLLCVLATPLPAQDWAGKMFETTSHDFGTIARGAKAEFRFELENIYLDDVHIAAVRASCGCTTPRIEQPWLKTYEKGAIVAKINSDKFLGPQQATISVTIDQPRRAQVQLHVKVNIQSSLTFEPASVMLGDVERGQEVERTISVHYTGGGNWRIVEVRSVDPYLAAKAIEEKRSPSRVSYNLTVHLDKNAPPGYIRQHLVLVTKGGQSGEIPILVEGQVLPDLTVSPTSLFLGVVRPGEKVARQIVVRSKKPFRITSMSGDCQCIQLSNVDKEARPLHIVPVTFLAGDQSGRVAPVIHIRTDLDHANADIPAYAVISSDR